MKTRFFQWIGYALAMVALLLALSAALTYLASQGSELRRPLPLAAGQQITQQFQARTDGVYFIDIDLQRNLPFAQLQHVLSKPLPVSWAVQSTGKSVGHPVSDTYWREDFGYTVGQFHAEKGRTYTVHAGFQKPSPTLALLKPNLLVELSPVQVEQKGFRATAFLLTALLAFALAVLLIRPGTQGTKYAE